MLCLSSTQEVGLRVSSGPGGSPTTRLRFARWPCWRRRAVLSGFPSLACLTGLACAWWARCNLVIINISGESPLLVDLWAMVGPPSDSPLPQRLVAWDRGFPLPVEQRKLPQTGSGGSESSRGNTGPLRGVSSSGRSLSHHRPLEALGLEMPRAFGPSRCSNWWCPWTRSDAPCRTLLLVFFLSCAVFIFPLSYLMVLGPGLLVFLHEIPSHCLMTLAF